MKLRKLGWTFDRHGPGSHEVWRHGATGRKAEGTLRAILREGQINVDDFLAA